MKIQDLVKVMWANKLVLTTAQLAAIYTVKPDRIRDNFRRAKKQFKEGEDYFKLEGEALRQLKEGLREEHDERVCLSDSLAPFLTSTKALTLWTYKGCIRHCKMINTQAAWDMFNELARVYFGVVEGAIKDVVEVTEKKHSADDLKESLRRAQLQSARPCHDLAVVYVLLLSNFIVKIGMTKDINERIANIESESKMKVLDCRTTPYMPKGDALKFESFLKEKYAPYCIGGEYFEVNFHEVCANF